MLLVKAGSDEPNPPTSAIVVHTPSWSPCSEPGYWTLSGPEVYYTKRDDEDDDDDDEDDQSGSEKTMTEEDTSKYRGVPLDTCLEKLRESCQGEEREISIIVNPHGRYVVGRAILL